MGWKLSAEIRGLIAIFHSPSHGRNFLQWCVGCSTSLVFTLTTPQCGAKLIRLCPCHRGGSGGNRKRERKERKQKRETKRTFRASTSDRASGFPLSFPPLTPASRATKHRIQFFIQNFTCWSPAKWSHYSKKRTYCLDEMPWAFTSTLFFMANPMVSVVLYLFLYWGSYAQRHQFTHIWQPLI